MIVPMMKYSFLVYHADYATFLSEIKKMGVLHIQTKQNEQSAEIQDKYRSLTDLFKTIRSLEERKQADDDGNALMDESISGEEVLEKLRAIEKEIEHKNHQLSSLEKEIQQLYPWGDFSALLIKEIASIGVTIRFLICKEKKYNPEWEQVYCIEHISNHAGFTHFIVCQQHDEDISELLSLVDVDEITIPTITLSEAEAKQRMVQEEINSLQQQITAIATHHLMALKNLQNIWESAIADSNAYLQTEKTVDNYVMLIEGYIPEPKTEELHAYLAMHDIVYTAEKPLDEEKVPVLLKNNRFTKVFEFIGSLYELPNHKELDLTPFFAPFYMLFFGFALGDAGYGLLIVIAATVLKFKKPAMKGILTLAQFLGISTVIFGALTGTLFGINLMNVDIAWLQNAKQYMINTDKMFTLALALGTIQILFGMVLKVVNLSMAKGFAYAYSTIGWLILIIGLGANYFLTQLQAYTPQSSTYIQYGVLSISGALILLFNNPKRNILMNFLAGLWDVYGMLTGLIGDLLSYIRLFALGVSSAILGFVFNELAMSLRPDNIILGPIVMIIILVLGHGMTIFMSALGAFVHPIRLTFVEFYKNAGFVGGGKAYKPFAEKKEN